jgi:two-component system OmpR family response regulator
MKILLIEDDVESASHLIAALNNGGHQVDHATSGREGLGLAMDGAFDVAIVDRMLPGIDGLTLVRMLKAAQVPTRVIFVTTMAGIDDRVDGFNAGRDDSTLCIGDLEFNLVRRQVKRGGRTLELQPQDQKLLEVLMRNAGRIVTRTMLLEQVWDFHFDPRTSIVETQVSRLRSKIDRPGEPSLIETVRGSGYCFRNAR